MATETITFTYPTGKTLTAKLFAYHTDTLAHAAANCTEYTNKKGYYYFDNTTGETGVYEVEVLDGTTPVIAGLVSLLGTARILDLKDPVDVQTIQGTVQTAGDVTALINALTATIGTPSSTSPATIAHDIANISAAIVTGTPSQIYASANSLDRGTARQATSPWNTGGTASTYLDTLTSDTNYLAASPLNTTATVNGIASVSLWETLTFKCGVARANYVSVYGYYSGGVAPRVLDLYAYDYVSTTWKLISSTANRMNNASADATYGPYYLTPAMQKNLTVGDGEVKIAFVSSGTTTGDIMHLNLVYISASTAGPTATEIAAAVKQDMLALYYPEGVWIDSVNGVSGTVVGTNGIRSNPVLALSDAATIAASLNSSLYSNKPGSTLLLDRSMVKTVMQGPGGWLLQLGGQDISGATIRNAELITGVSSAPSVECFVYDCQLGTSSWGEVDFHRCHIMDATITLVDDKPYLFDACVFVPMASVPSIDFNTSTGNRRVVISGASGMFTIKNMKANNVLLVEGDADITLESSCTAGTVILLGNMRLTNNGSGQTIYHDDDTNNLSTLIARLGAWAGTGNNTVLGAIRALAAKASSLTPTDISSGTTFDNTTDSLEAQRDNAGTSGAGLTAIWDEPLTAATHNVPTSSGRRLRQIAAQIVIDGIATAATENTISLDSDASSTNGAYDPSLIFISGGTGAGQCRLILEYNGSTKTAVVDRDWKVVPSTDSTYVIMGDAGREHVNEGLAQAGGTSTITLNALASSTDNAYIAQRVFIRSGLGEDQSRRVIAYNGTTKVATVSRPWDVVPDNTSAYVMLPTGAINDNDLSTAVCGSANAATIFNEQLEFLPRFTAKGSPAANTMTLDDTDTGRNHKYEVVQIVGGTGANQSPRRVTDHTAQVITVDRNFDVQPSSDSVYQFIGYEP